MQLSDAESRVMALLATGAANKLIARQLDVSVSTIKVHVRSIIKKYKVHNRTQAVVKYLSECSQ
jgi:DNA-binding NarL/FixJ family response regulator